MLAGRCMQAFWPSAGPCLYGAAGNVRTRAQISALLLTLRGAAWCASSRLRLPQAASAPATILHAGRGTNGAGLQSAGVPTRYTCVRAKNARG